MTEQQRERAIRLRLARSEEREETVLPTGFAALDSCLGGGLPRSAIVELFGPSSSGKTTLAFQIAAYTQKHRGTVAWIDAEHVFDAPYASRLGVAVEKMPLSQPESAEQALEIACTLAGSGAVDLMIVDSAAALVPMLELASPMGDTGAGLHTRVLASGLRKLAQVVRIHRVVALFLNQTRSRKSEPGDESETSAGGPPLKLYASLRLSLEPQTDEQAGFRILKNKAAGASRAGQLGRLPSGEFTGTP